MYDMVLFFQMDRNTWMYMVERFTADYMKGLSEFMKCAEDHQERMRETKISCPCKECRNSVSLDDPNMIKRHLIEHGFDKNYTCWDLHGETREPQVDSQTFVSDTNHEENDSNDDNHRNNLDEILRRGKKEYKDLHEGPVCMESRYQHKNLTELDSDVTKNGPPAKLL
ncbi:ulp1 protease family, C-terminal catalytic domain-containing protein [Tanacetum coccineum]